MKSKTELRAAATARAVEVIASEMGGWSLDGFAHGSLPNFSPLPRQQTQEGSVVLERPPFDYTWAGTAAFTDRANRALQVKLPASRERNYIWLCAVEREAVATALIVESFNVTGCAAFAGLPPVDGMVLLTMDEADVELIRAAMLPVAVVCPAAFSAWAIAGRVAFSPVMLTMSWSASSLTAWKRGSAPRGTICLAFCFAV